jgi:hypothetical protein
MATAPRFAVGVFTGWPPLVSAATAVVQLPGPQSPISVLGKLASFLPTAAPTIRGYDARVWEAFANKAKLLFPEAEALGCSNGLLAQWLRKRIDEGCTGLGDALSPWMMEKQAKRFEEDVRHGRLLLWMKVPTPEQERQVCEALLNERLHRLEVHDFATLVGP